MMDLNLNNNEETENNHKETDESSDVSDKIIDSEAGNDKETVESSDISEKIIDSEAEIDKETVESSDISEKKIDSEAGNDKETDESSDVSDKIIDSEAGNDEETDESSDITEKKIDSGAEIDKETDVTSEISGKKIDFEAENDEENKIIKLNSNLGNIPEKPIKFINALGDLHGWAPGLITYLITNQLAKIEINGCPLYTESLNDENSNKKKLGLNVNNLKKVFPNPLEYYKENGKFNYSYLKHLQIDDNQPVEDNSEEGFYSIKAEWIGPEDRVFIQVGDIFDRSDYSELCSEILQQLLIQAPFRVFVLVGNHEQFLLEDDFDTWIYNEEKFSYSEDRRNNGFHTRFNLDTYKNKNSQFNNQTLKKAVFNSYRKSCALLYLTQFCSQIEAIKKIKSGLKENFANYKIDYELVLNGGRNAYKYAKQFLLEISNKKIDKFPGALAFLGICHTVFIHSEPKCFQSLDLDEFKKNIECFKTENNQILYSTYRMNSNSSDIQNSPDFPILWSRGGFEGYNIENPRPKAAEYIQKIVKILPGIRHLVHGHTPTTSYSHFVELNGNFPISYLARNYGETLSTKTGSVRIHNIDEGINPVYHGDKTSKFDPCRIPTGLRIHKDVVKFNNLNDELIEEDSKDWLKIITEGEIFETPSILKLKERTKIGVISPDMAFWSDLKSDINYPENRFIFSEDNSIFKNCKLFRLSSRFKVPSNGISFIIYKSIEDPLRKPNKIYLNSLKKNLPLDKLIYEDLNISVRNWIDNSLENSPVLPKKQNEIDEWISDIFSPKKKFGNKYESIKEYGLNILIGTSEIIFALIGLDKKGFLFIFIINGTKKTIEFCSNTVSPVDISEKLKIINLSVPKNAWKFERVPVPFKKPCLINWGISNEGVKIQEISIENIKKKSIEGELNEYLDKTRDFGGLIWFSKFGDFLFPDGDFINREGKIEEFINFAPESSNNLKINDNVDKKTENTDNVEKKSDVTIAFKDNKENNEH